MRWPSSLKWRLVLWVGTVQFGFVTLLALLFLLGTLWADGNDTLVNDYVGLVLADLTSFDETNRLTLNQDWRLRLLKQRQADFWFEIHADGKTLSYNIPPAFKDTGWFEAINGLSLGEGQWGNNEVQGFFGFDTYDIQERRVKIITGGLQTSWAIFLIGLTTEIILYPTLFILGFVILPSGFAVIVAVRLSLRPLQEAVVSAQKIDFERPDKPLPDANIPTEIVPLITAINAALVRIDRGRQDQRRFLAVAAHELRTPVAILSAKVEDYTDTPIKASLQEHCLRLANLVDQLFDVERLVRGGGEFEECDLVALTRNIVADMTPLILSNGYDMEFSAPEHIVPLKMDTNAVRHALYNLIGNALHHGGRKGTLRVSISDDRKVSISDEGPGLDPAMRDRLFRAFERSDKEGGLGLGLYLVKEIAAVHEGYIAAQSPNPDTGKGVSMTLCLRTAEN